MGNRTKDLLLLATLLFVLSLCFCIPFAGATRSAINGEQSFKEANHAACRPTPYPDLCFSTLAAIPNLDEKSGGLPKLIHRTIAAIQKAVLQSSSSCNSIYRSWTNLGSRQRMALNDCQELFAGTLSELGVTDGDLGSSTLDAVKTEEVLTLLSASMTNQYTCLEGFAYSQGTVQHAIEKGLYGVIKLVSNSLALAAQLKPNDTQGYGSPPYAQKRDGFPAWMSAGDRKLLQATLGGVQANVVVAKDGSGRYTNVSDAVAAAPSRSNSSSRYVIYIKAGTYDEIVEVPSAKTNLMFVGDGIGKTVITGNRNVVDGFTTFRSATVAVVGNGFIARDITFQNTAGASKHQAVALRVGSDLAAFYRCSFLGYQDTLYVHSLRQFFRECDIYGTVDFIFGNSAVVFQNCNLYARRPDPNQQNIYTAQGREDPNQNTGISIQGCKLSAAPDLVPVKSSFKTYLGRPWKLYSRTVVMQSQIDDVVDPAGWLEWSGNFALNTLFYREYANTGAGAGTSKRVTWPGYGVINSSSEASQFTVQNFIGGDVWLPATGVPFSLGL